MNKEKDRIYNFLETISITVSWIRRNIFQGDYETYITENKMNVQDIFSGEYIWI